MIFSFLEAMSISYYDPTRLETSSSIKPTNEQSAQQGKRGERRHDDKSISV